MDCDFDLEQSDGKCTSLSFGDDVVKTFDDGRMRKLYYLKAY
jgi:hypothetical protein